MSVQTFWSEDRWTRAYGYRPSAWEENPYTLGFHIGQDVAGGDWWGPVPALRAGRVVDSGRGGKIGGYVVVQVGSEFDTYCHLNSANLPRSGTWLDAGDDVAPLARSTSPRAGDNYMGSASDGAHCHFVRSLRQDTAYNPIRSAVLDPRPIIRGALAGTASDGSRPFAPTEPPKRRKHPMVNAAWRDENGTIAVQAVPGGKVTLLTDPQEWAGIQAATGAEYASVTPEQLAGILARYGQITAPAFDTQTGAAATIIVPLDGQADRYQTVGDRLEWIDGDQLSKLQAQGARTQFLARDQIDRLKA